MVRIGRFHIRWPDDTSLDITVGNSWHISVLEKLGFVDGAEVMGSIEEHSSRPALLAFSNDKDGLFEPLRLLEETSYELVVALPLKLEEAQRLRRQSGFSHWPFLNIGLGNHIQILSPRLWKQDGTLTLVSAFFNPKGYAGRVDFSLLDSNHRLGVEVVSAKLGYEQEFKRLLKDVAEQHIQFLYEVGAVTGVRLKKSIEQLPDLTTTLFHLRRLMSSDELPAAIETVLASPLETLITVDSVSNRLGSGYPDPAFLSAHLNMMALRQGGALRGMFRGHTPRRVPQREKKQTFDNAENRYVKGFLQALAELLVVLREACNLDEHWIAARDVERWQDTVYEWLDNSIWMDVGEISSIPENSQRLQKSGGYRDILRADTELRDALEFPWEESVQPPDAQLGDVKPISALYEYWCYFTMRDILKELYGPDITNGENMMSQSAGKLSMRLSPASEGNGAIYQSNLAQGTAVHLFYNRRFRPQPEEPWGQWSGSYSVSFDPDISVAVRVSGVTHWLNFDAKYRLERFHWTDAAQESVSESSRPTYQQDDMNKMHCYRDAILGTRGAYVLYPGQSAEAHAPFLRTADMPRRGFSFPSVGAFTLRPGSQEQRAALREFIRGSIMKLASGRIYREEEGFT